MAEQPKSLTIVKIIPQGLTSRIVFARDEKGRIWKRLEGFGEAKWELFNA
jgi:hypothetical protein